MTLALNTRLWQEARMAGSQTGVNLYALARIQRHTLTYVSRLWVERHGERIAGMVSAILKRSVRVEDLFPNWDRPDERPLSSVESTLLRKAVGERSGELSPRELEIVRLTFGLEDQPVSLAQVAEQMHLTRERIRQIETAALEKLGVRFPRRRDKSIVARRRRARLLLQALNGNRTEQPRRTRPLRTDSAPSAGRFVSEELAVV